MQRQSLFAIAAMILILPIPAVSQSVFADGPFSGSLTCQLDIDQNIYNRHETQTWTLTGKKLQPNGDMRIYEATWAATGQGAYLTPQNAQGMQFLTKWTVNVPPMLTQLRFLMDRSGTTVNIAQWGAQPRADYGRATTRQTINNGVAGPAQAIPDAPIYAWDFQRISEGILSPNLSGSKTIQAAGLGAGTQPMNGQVGGPPATCTWQFTKGGTSSAGNSESKQCTQSSAAISQTFDAMESDITRKYETLIQQTKDSGQAAALRNQEKNLINQLENLKQQNIKASAASCNGMPGATYAGQNPPPAGQGMSGSSSTSNPGATNPPNSNGGQTSGTGQTQTGSTNPPQDCSQAIAAVTQQYDAKIQDTYDAYLEMRNAASANGKSGELQALNAQWQRTLANLQTQKQNAIAAAAQPCQSSSTKTAGQNSPPSGTAGTNSGQPTNAGQTQIPPDSSSQPGGTGSSSQQSPAPQLLKVAPASAQQNTATLQVALTGQGTHWLQGTTKLDFGPGITVQGQPVFLTATDGYVAVTVAPDAAVGPHTVTVTSPFPGKTETVALPNSFTVTAATNLKGAREAFSHPDKTGALTNLPPTNSSSGVKGAPQHPINTGALTNLPQSSAPATSGDYLITITGLKCAQATLDVPNDGLGDEVYAAAAVWRYQRFNGVVNGPPEFHDTVVYGDVSHAFGREMAGSKSPAGGLQSGDIIPMGVSFTRNAEPSNNRFPLRIFQGTLRDNLDALVISPSVWEYDNSGAAYLSWQGRLRDSFTPVLYSQPQVQEQINTKTFGSFVMNGLGINLPVPGIFTQTQNRPIGLVGKDFGTAIFPTTVVVLTREIIEAALSNSSFNHEPAQGVFISSPGNIVIGFADHGDANPLLNNTDLNDSKGIYYLVLQVERVASSTNGDPAGTSPASGPSASQNDIMNKFQKATEQQKQMQDSMKALSQP